jgi:twitching motility protein PilT
VLDLKQLLRMVAESGGSDVHLKVGSPPIVRVDGLLRRLQGEPLTTEDTDFITHSIVPPDRREKLEYKNEADFALSLAGVGRFRVNVFRQRGSISLVLRRVRVGSTRPGSPWPACCRAWSVSGSSRGSVAGGSPRSRSW